MRVISQDGTIDVPYERYTIWCYKDQYLDIYHIACDCGDEVYRRLADYSTEEKAKKAMEMLRERHTDNVFCREDIQYKAEMLLDDGLEIVREMMMKCEYFRFPKDDEVEV